VSGGLTAVAATRARALWLRTHWTRAELFGRAERAFWGHNCFVLGVLLVALVAVGSWLELPTRMLVLWLGLLMLGTTLSTYLGLIVTASLGWTECVLAAATMVALLMTSIYTGAATTPPATIVALYAALAVAALAFRQLATLAMKPIAVRERFSVVFTAAGVRGADRQERSSAIADEPNGVFVLLVVVFALGVQPGLHGSQGRCVDIPLVDFPLVERTQQSS